MGHWAKFNQHIHFLVKPKFGEHNRCWKGRSALDSNGHPFNTIQYNTIQYSVSLIIFVVRTSKPWNTKRARYPETTEADSCVVNLREKNSCLDQDSNSLKLTTHTHSLLDIYNCSTTAMFDCILTVTLAQFIFVCERGQHVGSWRNTWWQEFETGRNNAEDNRSFFVPQTSYTFARVSWCAGWVQNTPHLFQS